MLGADKRSWNANSQMNADYLEDVKYEKEF